MTLPLFLGCCMIAYGPAAVLFFALVFRQASLMLVFTTSAFFWLLSVFAVSILWNIIPPLEDSRAATIVLSALCQEVCRGFYLKLYRKAEDGLANQSTVAPPPLNDLPSAVTAGLGFGVMNAVIMYGSLLATSVGEAVLYSDDCDEMSLVVMAAISSFLFVALHTLWSVLMLDALRRESWLRGAVVVGLHLLASLLTLANTSTGGCAYSPALVACALVATAAATAFVASRPDYHGTIQAKWQAADAVRAARAPVRDTRARRADSAARSRPSPAADTVHEAGAEVRSRAASSRATIEMSSMPHAAQ